MPAPGCKERWAIGEIAWFEYHCWESPESGDATIWYRSHQQATVISEATYDGEPAPPDPEWDYAARAEAGAPNVYQVRFVDGLEWTAFEDELLTGSCHFYRPDPPRAPIPVTNA